jgi:hypothetical protein
LEDGIEEGNITDEGADLKMEESDIKINESEDMKEEIPEVITISPIKPEPEVSQQCFMLPRPFTATKRGIMEIHFNYPRVCSYRTAHFL